MSLPTIFDLTPDPSPSPTPSFSFSSGVHSITAVAMQILTNNLGRTLVFACSCAGVYTLQNVKEIKNKFFAMTASVLAATCIYLISTIDWVEVCLFLRPHWHEVGYALQGIMALYLLVTLIRKIWNHYHPIKATPPSSNAAPSSSDSQSASTSSLPTSTVSTEVAPLNNDAQETPVKTPSKLQDKLHGKPQRLLNTPDGQNTPTDQKKNMIVSLQTFQEQRSSTPSSASTVDRLIPKHEPSSADDPSNFLTSSDEEDE